MNVWEPSIFAARAKPAALTKETLVTDVLAEPGVPDGVTDGEGTSEADAFVLPDRGSAESEETSAEAVRNVSEPNTQSINGL